MKLIKPFIPVIIALLLPAVGFAQTLQTIDSLEEATQLCLDDGKNMLGCEQKFYL